MAQADIGLRGLNDCFGGKAGIIAPEGQVCFTQSGHAGLTEPAKQGGLSRTSACTAGVCRMTQEARYGLE